MALRPLAVALLALTGLLWTSEARADVFTVTSTSDAPGPVGCIALQCPTLRAAIAAATNNGATSDDEIVVPAGTIELVQGTLTVSSRVTIRGLGATRTIIRPNIEFPDRPLTVPSGAIVTLRDLTVRSGRPTSGVGGNVQVNNSATLTMTRVRVFDGRAQMGGGIGALGPTALTISQSLIDGNTATGTALTDIGGGLYLQGQTSATAVSITDSTIVSNSAVNGPAVGIVNNAAQTPSFVGVTMTRNDARPGANGSGIGGIFSQNTSARFAGSIVGGNTRTVNLGGGQSVTPSNCGLATPAIDDGGNVSPDQQDMCGLGGEHRDPLLPDELDGSEPPALAIPADSPAVDIADCGGRTVDQRGVARPQLGGCDAGAYEYQPPPPEPTPTPTPTPPVVVPTPTPTATPTPVAGRSVGVQPSGRVLVKLRGSRTFVPLGDGVLDNGAEVDTRDGAVVITRTDGGRARFFDGIFRISHSRGITTLTLTEQLAPCSSKARTAQKRKPKTRRLWGDGKGKFRTKGRYSAATVRGTKWLVTDGCRFTRTRVTQGSVLVRDSVRKRNIVVRKGKTYVARPRR